jgi:hypothetical protein
MMSGQQAWAQVEKMYSYPLLLGRWLVTQLNVRIVQLLQYTKIMSKQKRMD